MSIHTRGTDPHEPLDAVLRAASVPGHPEELAGEGAAVAAFQAAAPAPRRWPLLGRVLTVKAVVIAVLATSTGAVVATVGVVLPILRPEPAPLQPADPPAVTRTSVPAVPPPAGLSSATTEPPAAETTTQPPPPSGCDDCAGGREGKRDNPDDSGRSGKGKDGKGGQPPSTETRPAESSGRTQTPDSPARGAATAVPPNGAKPPSPGD